MDSEVTTIQFQSKIPAVCFKFGGEQRKAFNELKSRLASAETLGYFNKDARILIIADASQSVLARYLFKNNKEERE